MKLLLDECLPRRLKQSFSDYEVSTVPEMGWAGTKNGELLRLAVESFDVFITADLNLSYQQNLTQSQLAVIALAAPTNRLEDLLPLIPQIIELLPRIRAGRITRIPLIP
ncbi:MAG: DUF5615 family PIN-like protein [Pseudomonadota bacterium]